MDARDLLDLAWIIPALPGVRRGGAAAVRQAHRRTEGGLARDRDDGARVRRVGRRVLRAALAATRSNASRRSQRQPGLHVDPGRRLRRRLPLPRRSAVVDDDPVRHRRRHADPPVLDRLHARRPALLAVLRVPEPVRGVDARARARLELPAHVPGLGGRRALLLPADLVLVRAQLGRGRGQEGVRHEPRRRLRVHARDVPDLPEARHARLRAAERGHAADLSNSRPRPRSRCCCSSARSARARSSRCTSGCPTRWKAPRRSRRSSTRRRW